jgi:hypothetical protein
VSAFGIKPVLLALMLFFYQVWSGNMGKALDVITPCAEEKADFLVAAVSVAFRPNGEDIAVGYHDGHVRVYKILTGTF